MAYLTTLFVAHILLYSPKLPRTSRFPGFGILLADLFYYFLDGTQLIAMLENNTHPGHKLERIWKKKLLWRSLKQPAPLDLVSNTDKSHKSWSQLKLSLG
jgi:hypothetical protein